MLELQFSWAWLHLQLLMNCIAPRVQWGTSTCFAAQAVVAMPAFMLKPFATLPILQQR
jgi:hypothetical protein